MAEEPDLGFDIDELFKRYDIQEERDWTFFLRSADLDALTQVARELEDEFAVQLQENVTEVDEDGNESQGEPMLLIVRRGILTADEVKEIAERIRSIGKERGLVYEGVSSYEPIDGDEIFGWLPPDDAGWRLRHMSDCGLEDNAELPWTFLVLAPDSAAIGRIANALQELGFTDFDKYDEPTEDGSFALCVYFAGRNNEIELAEASENISQLAQRFGGQLAGIQFYTREEVNEVFGAGDDEIES